MEGALRLMANRRKDKLLKRVTISVDPDDYAVLEGIAERGDVSAAWLIRRSIREFLGRNSGGSQAGLASFAVPRFAGPEGRT